MLEQRKKVSIPSNDYKHVYGLSYGSIGTPYYETHENIKALLVDGVKVIEHIGEKQVPLTLENYDKDNSQEESGPVEVTTINLTLSKQTLLEGETTTASVEVLPSNATDKSVTYSTESQTIATVEQNGTVTAKGKGTTNIVATAKNKVVGKASITVNARPVEVATVTLTLTEDTITEGGTTTVTADVQPAEAVNKEVTYSSENDLVATVEQNGTVTAVGQGSTNIVGRTTNGTEGKVLITVNPVA